MSTILTKKRLQNPSLKLYKFELKWSLSVLIDRRYDRYFLIDTSVIYVKIIMQIMFVTQSQLNEFDYFLDLG